MNWMTRWVKSTLARDKEANYHAEEITLTCRSRDHLARRLKTEFAGWPLRAIEYANKHNMSLYGQYMHWDELADWYWERTWKKRGVPPPTP